MSENLDFNFGTPVELEIFVKNHSYLFERLSHLYRALDSAFSIKKQLNNYDQLILNLCKESVNIFNEVILLSRYGFSHGALKLLRGMFENFIIARNMHLHQEEIGKLFNDYLSNQFENYSINVLNQKKPYFNFFYKFDAPQKELKSNNFPNFWSQKDFMKLTSSAALPEPLKTIYHDSSEYIHSSVNPFWFILNTKNVEVSSSKTESQLDTSEIALSSAYYLLAETLFLMIEHFNLNDNAPLFQQCINDYEYLLKKIKVVFKKHSKPRKSESKTGNEDIDFKAKSEMLLSKNEFNQKVEESVGVSLNELIYLYMLESIKGFGPQKFKKLHESNISPEEVTASPNQLLRYGKAGEGFQSEMLKIMNSQYEEFRYKALYQINSAYKNKGFILTYNHPNYPRNVYESNNPIPILYVRGSLNVLEQNSVVACVGSRNIRSPYNNLQREFAKEASLKNFTVASGFALGADTIGHETAFANGGNTICIMPCGLDKPFPPENKDLWNTLLDYHSAAFVTEFPFGVRTNSLTLRKRNKLIVAFSLGVLIGQSSTKGGAMNAYRFALEQHKPVATFKSDESDDTSGNQLIEYDKKVVDAIFPNFTDTEAYQKWLQELYFLT